MGFVFLVLVVLLVALFLGAAWLHSKEMPETILSKKELRESIQHLHNENLHKQNEHH